MAIQRTSIALAAVLGLFASSASATIWQQVYTVYDPTDIEIVSPSTHYDFDYIEGDTDADIDRPLLASISAPGAPVYEAWGSVGAFGNYGLRGTITTAGQLYMSVAIGDSDIVNLTGRPQNVMANFIIDGGKFGLAYAPGATIEYDLRLDRDKATVFESSGELESYYSGPFNVTNFTSSGEDIGAVLDPLTATVDIPLSFQSVDLGVLLPNQSMQLLYVMEIFADVPSYAEYAVMEFEDPFSVSGSPVEPGILRPMVEFSEYDGPPLSNVPVPPAMLLFASALMVMLFGGRIGRSAA